MKKICSLCLLSIMWVTCFAQKEPVEEFEPYVLKSDNTLGERLPSEKAYQIKKASALRYVSKYGKSKTYWYIDGAKSALEISAESKIIINTGGITPKKSVTIYKLEEMSKKRRFQCNESFDDDVITIGKVDRDQSEYVSLMKYTYEKSGQNSVTLSLDELEAGEYLLSTTDLMANIKNANVYTFRIK